MERRNFLVGTMVFLGALKTALSSKKVNAATGDLSHLIGKNAEIIYLKRNQVVALPENPDAISTVIAFDVRKYRFGKSPEINLSGKKIDGTYRDNLVLTKDIKLHNKTQFLMQYIGEDVGWIVLV